MNTSDPARDVWTGLTRAVMDSDDAVHEFMLVHEWTEDDVLAAVKQIMAVIAAGAARIRDGT
jgi:uncharacterized membrane protein